MADRPEWSMTCEVQPEQMDWEDLAAMLRDVIGGWESSG